MQNRFTLRQLEYFVAVARNGSITLSAEQLAVSSPSISNAIAQLELELGLQLFVRKHAHGMALTRDGRELMTQAVAVLESARRLVNEADRRKGTISGEINVGCLLTFAQFVLPRLRRGFTTAYPAATFRQFQNHQTGLIEGLRDALLDVALTYDLAIPTDLDFIALGTLPPFAIFGDDHPLRNETQVTVQDLAELPMVLLDLPLSSSYFISLFEKAGLKPRIVERASDMAVVHSLVGNGFGYSILNIRPPSDAAPDGKRLHFVPLRGVLKPMRIGLLAAKGSLETVSVSAFVNLCREHLDRDYLTSVSVAK